ncbi:glycosyltransferase [Niveispirillum sp. BGYR6]|uniref:glycosyltransferase n=1 Tax=Niveispirillum sp. BGYR6 TaxID=2971249 RepID=UPI0022B98CF5|nr:glycosyltransferase [Niveispirillum sp. BGYR6]MDG5496855.1 colanic acid biosynthesis glycosyl transferase [Niveispirillum sp. BGYR6]
MGTPALSIITVVRQDRAGLAATRASLGTMPTGVEWLVADGGSTDDTLAALNGPGPQPDWLDSRADGGPFGGMDRALAQARGEFVLFLNAGDRLADPTMLSTLLALTQARDAADLIYGDAAEDPGDGLIRRKPARHWRWAFYGMPAHHCAILYRRQLLAGLRFHCGYRIAGDYAVTVQALARTTAICRIPLLIACFAPGGLSRRQAARGRDEQHHIRMYYLKLSPSLSLALKLLQSVAAILRKYIPKTYALMRFRRH